MIEFKINGMGCMHCVKVIEEAVNSLDIVNTAKVDFDNKILNVEFLDKENNDNNISIVKEAVEEVGYDLVEL